MGLAESFLFVWTNCFSRMVSKYVSFFMFYFFNYKNIARFGFLVSSKKGGGDTTKGNQPSKHVGS